MDKTTTESRVALYKKAIEQMIATNEDSYKSYNSWSSKYTSTRIREYTDEEIEAIINSGDIDSMRGLSRSYYYSSGYYRRIILYYAYLLKYCYVLIPHFKKKVSAQSKSNYYAALDLCENLHITSFSQHIATRCLVDGCYFGIIVEQGTKISTMDLPFSYCRTRFKGFSGLDIVELNLQYFTTITDKETRLKVFDLYPKIVKKEYEKYIQGKRQSSWLAIDEGLGIYFQMDEARPMFINTIPTIETFDTYKNLELRKQELETKRIFVQELGMNKDGEFLIEPDEAAELHAGAVRMLANNIDMDVLTTYADVDVKNLSDSRQTVSSNLTTFANFIYDESGASANIFNSKGNLSMEYSLKNDLSLMMTLAEKISEYFTYLINNTTSSKSISYTFTILPVSFFNEDEYLENTYKLATAGYSFILPALVTGLKQRDIADIKVLENDILELQDIFIPLQLSSTQTGDEAGAPAKKQIEKSDKTVKNQNGGEE